MQQNDLCSSLTTFPNIGCDGERVPPQRKQGCIVSPFTPEEQDLLRAAKEKMSAEQATADRMGITVARLTGMRNFAKKLHLQHPRWTKDQVQKKVAKQYNVKLV